MITWLPGLILFGVLIAIHEFGHFLACRLSKVKVDKFSIGFGPELFKIQGKETLYTVSLLPLGGFVKPAGEQISEIEGGKPLPGDYLAAPVSSRIFIVCAGVIMNYLLAFVLLLAFFAMPHTVPATVIGEIQKDSPAAEAGLFKGDRILSVDGRDVRVFSEVKEAIVSTTAAVIDFKVERSGAFDAMTQIDVRLTPNVVERKDVFGKKTTERMAGFIPDAAITVSEQYSFIEAIKKSRDL